MLHKRSIKEKLLKGSVWAFLGKVLTALAMLGINALLARLLTPDEMGAYFLTFSLVSVAAIVAQLGLTQAIVKLVAESMGINCPSRAKQSVILAIRIVALSGLAVACLLSFGVGQWVAEFLFKSALISQVVGLAALWVIIITFQTLIAEVYRGFHDIFLATLFGGLITSLVSMVLFLGLWLILSQGSLEQVIILAVISGVSSVFLSSALLWNKLKKIPSEKNNIILTEVLMVSWPLWIANLTLFMLTQIDLWILGVFSSPDEVAVYGAAVRTMTLVTMPLLIVNSVVPPIITEMYVQGKLEQLEEALRLVATLTGVLSVAVLSLFVFFGDSILALLYGEYYQSGFILLLILSVGQLANVWAGSCGLTLMFTGHQSTMMMITILCGLFTAMMAWLLVSLYGGVGVAVAASSGMVLQNLLMLFFAKKKVGVWTHVNLRLLKKIGASK